LIKLDQGRAEPDVETMDLLDFSRFVSNIKVGKGFVGFITQENFIYDGCIFFQKNIHTCKKEIKPHSNP
jgi:hypothetical protein